MANECLPKISTPKLSTNNQLKPQLICDSPQDASMISPVSPLHDVLLCTETLDRSSPDLWPETIPGIRDFVQSTSLGDIDGSDREWLTDFDVEEINLLCTWGNLGENALLNKVKEYYNLAFELGVEESKEMSRGAMLQVLGPAKRSNRKRSNKGNKVM
ncbi:Protein lin-52 -like protein [Halotydeus destructor]|nr:Protein lin-52 -like protein [Halotydeus destructor]